MAIPENERCSVKVCKKGMNWPRYFQCTRRSVVEHDGKLYCKQHNPEAVKARHKKRKEDLDTYRAGKQKRWDREAAEKQACTSIGTDSLTPGLVRELVVALVEYALLGSGKCIISKAHAENTHTLLDSIKVEE